MNEHNFSVKLNLRIDWSELDYFGHVNNVSIFKYVQAARVNYWEQIGLTALHKNMNIGPMLASCKCDFKKPLFYPGEVTMLTRVDEMRTTSFSISHELINDKGEIAGQAKDIVVMFDFNKNEKVSIPTDLRKAIEKLENRTF